ncbi:hypothetical protein SAMN05444398_1169 [Roseovarius pacificus]|uniref:Uncharacterized protein n=1 Tax=Roseovarius pacificus TaxID=337701 RepID=A0A1M7IMZ6_9RHOB|nr:hypothetical protein [Roseovarius pacificus]GGO61524.1 hypothetical protein GCM10011315_38420 [Roseovarius pacificus]SHM42100.1 hypothetical protein SAMN05444398_1169 [Roseovarius pacificus]
MTTVEIYISVGSVIASAMGVLYVLHAVRHAGRDRPHDPAAVQRFIESAARLSAERGEGCLDEAGRAETAKKTE